MQVPQLQGEDKLDTISEPMNVIDNFVLSGLLAVAHNLFTNILLTLSLP